MERGVGGCGGGWAERVCRCGGVGGASFRTAWKCPLWEGWKYERPLLDNLLWLVRKLSPWYKASHLQVVFLADAGSLQGFAI